MNKMTRLGPHTFVSQDSHAHGDQWLHNFTRDERHRLVEEDRSARMHVAVVLGCTMGFGLLLLLVALVKYV
jgi:hypothetical protein